VTQHAQLNHKEHRDLKVITAHGAAYGDEVMYVMTFPGEFRNVQAHYPIVFAKSREGEFMPLALFGFREQQNLFLRGEVWDATYRPLMIDRQPFLIGQSGANKMVHIDLDSPRVSRTEGEALFDENGGNSVFLDRVSELLGAIDAGMSGVQPFIAALVEHNLLEPFVLDIEFRDGARHSFAGFHAIQEERLGQLSVETIGKLHALGYLQAIYMSIASLSHFRELIERASKLDAGSR